MTTVSYQNSFPGQMTTTVLTGRATNPKCEEPSIMEDYDDENRRSTNKKNGGRSFVKLVVGAVALFFFVNAYSVGGGSKNAMLRGGSSEISLLQLPLADAASPSDMQQQQQPEADYNGEGRYDWQKCKASNDPDCWKNEGERVGGYWHNFGLRMQTFWKNFGSSIHNFFAGSGNSSSSKSSGDGSGRGSGIDGVVEEETIETEKKHHHHKTTQQDVPAAAVNATVAP